MTRDERPVISHQLELEPGQAAELMRFLTDND